MLNRDETLLILRANRPLLEDEFGLKSLDLLGSVARDEVTEESDVDLIADFERPLGLRFVEFVEKIEELLGMEADVLTPAGVEDIPYPHVSKAIRESAIHVQALHHSRIAAVPHNIHWKLT